MIKKLWQHLTKQRRKQFFLLLILMILASIMEIVSIGAVVPFLGALTSPEQIYQHQLAQPLIQILEITEPNQLLLPLSIIFIVATLIAAAVRLLLLYVSTRLSYAAGADISINIYRRTLYQDYSVHTSRNSSEIINSIITKTNTVIGQLLVPLLTLVGSVIIMLGIISIIFIINAQVALITFSIFAFLYWVITFFTKKSLQKNSQLIANKSTKMVKSLQEGLGGIRDVLIDGTQEFYCKLYQDADLSLRRASGDNVFIGQSPRYLMEGVGMVLIATIAYSLTLQEGGIVVAIPVLGALAVSAQKLLPALQMAYNAYSSIKGAKSSNEDVLYLLDQPLPEYINQPIPKAIQFDKEIKLTNLSFRYTQESPWILKNINLSLKKGSCIGFIGSTGNGKSTLIDIIMGLLPATEGNLIIDQKEVDDKNFRSWQARIAHVPQNIYLSDSSIEENIAFGISKDKINHQQVKKAAQRAQIGELIEQWEDGYQTIVGERGVRLSGGQRQRIGIARAFYKKSNVLIFDEATSALDNETEQEVMEAIKDLGSEITVLIIAHRLTTLRDCDKVVKLGKNHTLSIGSYQEIVNK
jgi:ATP-binding cassette, subfamily B, bacterial PglK